jgi:natural resistance-associated macrophage protein
MSIAYVDPGNIESDLQAGVAGGYGLLWVVAWATALGFLVQMQSAKLGVATSRDLAQHCRRAYPRPARAALWAAAQLAVVGADIQECVGSAIALRLLSGGRLPLPAGVAIGAAASALLLTVERWGARPMEATLGSLVAVMVAAFGAMAARADVSARGVLEGFLIPRLHGGSEAVGQAVALLGSILMPHNTFLHSALVQSRRLDGTVEARRDALRYYRIESALSLAVSVGINACVMSVFAAGFHQDGGAGGGGGGVAAFAALPSSAASGWSLLGLSSPSSSSTPATSLSPTTTTTPASTPIGLENAGYYLQRAYGPGAAVVWALGLLAAGQSSTCTGTYTSQFLVAMLDAPRALRPWARVALARAAALLPTLLVAALASTRLDELSQWMNLLQALVLPCVLLPLLALNASPRVVGRAFANPRGTTVALAGVSAAVVAANLAGVASFLGEALAASPAETRAGAGLRGALAVFGAGYAALLLYLAALAPSVARHGHGRGGGVGKEWRRLLRGWRGGEAALAAALAEAEDERAAADADAPAPIAYPSPVPPTPSPPPLRAPLLARAAGYSLVVEEDEEEVEEQGAERGGGGAAERLMLGGRAEAYAVAAEAAAADARDALERRERLSSSGGPNHADAGGGGGQV